VAHLALLRARFSGAVAARALFALLVVATVGAFFLTTRLKRSAPIVEGLTFARYLSPNDDGRHEFVDIGFRIKRSDEVTVLLVSEQGDEVRTLTRDVSLPRGRHRFRWDGRLDSGALAPDGKYRVRVGLRGQGRTVTSPRRLFVDTRPPRPVVRYVAPDAISPDGAGSGNQAMLRFDGPLRHRPTLLVYRTDLASPRLVARRVGQVGKAELAWNGRIDFRGRGRPAPSGNYLLVVRVRDAAGNVGPSGLPPARGELEGHPGVVVRYVAAQGPSRPVQAGTPVRFAVESDGRRYRWRVRRLGSRRALQRGSSRAQTLQVRAPRGRAGVFLLALRVGRHRYETPFAVRTNRPARVLVVLPATTWQARNEVDANGDGFADRLSEDRQVALSRPFAGSGLPPGFSTREAPLLLLLDRSRRRYDVTTDLELSRHEPRSQIRNRGVLFAGAPRFFSQDVGDLLRSYVRSGGRLAWFGGGGFTQPVTVRGDKLHLAPAASADANFLGERLRSSPEQGLLTVLGDRIDFFRGVGGAFGPFPSLEESARLPRGARLLASAGAEADRPALVVYREARGIVARVGVEGFARAASDSAAAARIMRRLWILVSR
jgi:hypothetical protein